MGRKRLIGPARRQAEEVRAREARRARSFEMSRRPWTPREGDGIKVFTIGEERVQAEKLAPVGAEEKAGEEPEAGGACLAEDFHLPPGAVRLMPIAAPDTALVSELARLRRVIAAGALVGKPTRPDVQTRIMKMLEDELA